MGKQVPLVIYERGKRVVVGMASVSDDGTVEALVNRDSREVVKKLINPSSTELIFSVFKKPSKKSEPAAQLSYGNNELAIVGRIPSITDSTTYVPTSTPIQE